MGEYYPLSLCGNCVYCYVDILWESTIHCHFVGIVSTVMLTYCGIVVVVVDPTPPTCCQQSPAPESCGSQQSLPPGGKERLHFVGIRPEVQARKGGW